MLDPSIFNRDKLNELRLNSVPGKGGGGGGGCCSYLSQSAFGVILYVCHFTSNLDNMRFKLYLKTRFQRLS